MLGLAGCQEKIGTPERAEMIKNRDSDNRWSNLTIMRVVMIVGIIVFFAFQFYYLFKADGTLDRYGFFGSFEAWSRVSLADPITATAFIDLLGMMVLFLVMLVHGVPKGRGYFFRLIGLVLVLVVYPALAMLLYLLFFWRRSGQFRP